MTNSKAYIMLKQLEPWDSTPHILLPHHHDDILMCSTANRDLFNAPRRLRSFTLARQFCKFVLTRKCERDVLDILSEYCIDPYQSSILNIFDEIDRQQTIGKTILCFTFQITEDSYFEDVAIPDPTQALQDTISNISDADTFNGFITTYGSHIVCGRKQYNVVVTKLRWYIPTEADAMTAYNTIINMTQLKCIDFETLQAVVQQCAFDVPSTAVSFPIPGEGTCTGISYTIDYTKRNLDKHILANASHNDSANRIKAIILTPWSELQCFRNNSFANASLRTFYSNKKTERDSKLNECFPSRSINGNLRKLVLCRFKNGDFETGASLLNAVYTFSPEAALQLSQELLQYPTVFYLARELHLNFKTSVDTHCFPGISQILDGHLFTIEKAEGSHKGQVVSIIPNNDQRRDACSYYCFVQDRHEVDQANYLWRLESRPSKCNNGYYIHINLNGTPMTLTAMLQYRSDKAPKKGVYTHVRANTHFKWILMPLSLDTFAIGFKMKSGEFAWLNQRILDSACYAVTTKENPTAWKIIPYCPWAKK